MIFKPKLNSNLKSTYKGDAFDNETPLDFEVTDRKTIQGSPIFEDLKERKRQNHATLESGRINPCEHAFA